MPEYSVTGGAVQDCIHGNRDDWGQHTETVVSPRRLGIQGLIGFACLVTLGCAAKLVPPPPYTAPTYRIGPPDGLLIHILPQPEIERAVVVRPDGFISVDLIGDVMASGRSVEEIAADIQEKISRYKRDALVTVSLIGAASSSVSVFGELRQPGTFSLARHTRVAEAIGLRGGTTIFASKSRIRIIRSKPAGETQVLRVDLNGIQRGDLSTNVVLWDGDIVFVPPNSLARVGYALQLVLFPFQQILSAGTGALVTAAAF